jgi:hypothetical protein
LFLIDVPSHATHWHVLQWFGTDGGMQGEEEFFFLNGRVSSKAYQMFAIDKDRIGQDSKAS